MLVSPGVHRIVLPLPFELSTVNVYLVRQADGFLLIDCGIDTAQCFDAFDRARQDLGFAWPDIHGILLTHIHPDHMGLAPRLLALTGARLMMHPDDARMLAQWAKRDVQQMESDATLRAAGVPEDRIVEIDDAFEDVNRNFFPLRPDVELTGGEKIETAAGLLEVVWTPGHSPGHICLYERKRQVLFSGDHVLQYISPNITWIADSDPLDDYLRSLEKLEELDVDLILPSHGHPFTGLREWIRKTLAHHEERCQLILKKLEQGARTPHELALSMWPRQLSAFHYRFAIFEVLAHLEYLANRGQIVFSGGRAATSQVKSEH